MSTGDGGSLRVSLLISYKIVDPRVHYLSTAGSSPGIGSNSNRVHFLAQTALRDWISSRIFREAFDGRGDMAADLLPVVAEGAKAIGIEVEFVQALDVSMVGTLRNAYSDLVKAQIEGEASLARARNEASTMRSLLNTARLVRDHPGLLELRVLSTGQKPKVTFVVGGQSGKSPILADETEES